MTVSDILVTTLPTLTTSTSTVTVFDLREWYQGSKRGEDLNFGKILPEAPLLINEEITVESLVGVLYTMGYWVRQSGPPQLNLNLLGVVLLVSSPDDYRRSKNFVRKK